MSADDLSEANSEGGNSRLKGFSIQNTAYDLANHIIELTKAGAFQGNHTARTLYAFYCHRMAVNDKGRDFVRGEVMLGCTVPAVVESSTGLGREAVRKANEWLHVQGFVWIGNVRPNHQRDIVILTTDAESEAERLAVAGRIPPPELLIGRPAKGRWTWADDQDQAEDEGNSHQTGVRSHETGVFTKETPARKAHTLQSSSLYKSDIDMAVPPPAAGGVPPSTPLEEEEEEEEGSASPRPATAEEGSPLPRSMSSSAS